METLEVERDDGVVAVRLNRPEKLNAISPTMFRELAVVLDEVTSRTEDRVLVLSGAGGNFCSGADLSEPAPDEHRLRRMREVGDVALALHRLPKPTIAVVEGVAVGAGCNLALGCDLVFAADTARFSEIFVRRGLSVDFGGTWLLPRIVGLQRAKLLAFGGEIVSATQAAELGLVTAVAVGVELEDLVDTWARRLADGPPIALSLTKAMLNSSFDYSMADALEHEGRSQTINFLSEDAAEGRAAFAEKREPHFRGR